MWKENEKKPIIAYLLITFAISWLAELLVILLEQISVLPPMAMKVFALMLISFAAAGPGISVYILLKKHGKIKGIKDYTSRIFACRSGKSFILGLLFSFTCFAVFVVSTAAPVDGMPIWILPLLLVFMIPGGGWEELGWRGFLQPALEEKLGFSPGTLLMGVIWAIWHLPLWMVQSANQKDFKFWAFTMYCIVFSFLLAATYKITKSVFAAILLHAWGNTMCGGMYSFEILVDGPGKVEIAFMVGIVVISTVVYYVMDMKPDKITINSEKV